MSKDRKDNGSGVSGSKEITGRDGAMVGSGWNHDGQSQGRV